MSNIKKLSDFGFHTNNNTYIIAEIGINHGGDINVAKQLIDSAARAGVDSVKFQTYLTEKRVAKDSPIFDILKKCELPFSAFEELKAYAESKNVDFFSTPFDEESVDFLNGLGIELYKVASFDIVNRKLLRKVAQTKKPIILSVGMSSLDEIKDAYEILAAETKNIALLHCISAYPTQEEDAHLAVVHKLKQEFDCIIGQSDHTNDIIVPQYAVAAGAQIIEKHYKIDEKMDCIDAPVSITENQMSSMISEIRRIEKIMGSVSLGVRDAEKEIEVYRRPSE